MEDITWYDVLGVLTTASAQTVQQAYDHKASLLRPEAVAGAPSTVVTAASRARGILDAARRVLGDPVSREQYDEAVGIRRSAGGLYQAENSPSEPGLRLSDFGFAGGGLGVEALSGLMALTDWLTPHARQPKRIDAPDLRGLFFSVCIEIAGRLDLRVRAVQITEHPRPVDGLVVDQSPRPPAKMRRTGELTVQVWHPPVGAVPGRSVHGDQRLGRDSDRREYGLSPRGRRFGLGGELVPGERTSTVTTTTTRRLRRHLARVSSALAL